jgi:tetratricopeptide (TPR) repeat protein
VALAVNLAPAEVRGQSPAGGEALALARQAYDAGRLQEAIEGFKRAYELSGDLTLLFRLGEVSREVGQDVAALRFYRTYLARDPRGQHREAAERAVSDLELKMAKPGPPIAPARPPVVAGQAASQPARPGARQAAPAPPPAPTSVAPPSSPSPPPASAALPAVDLRAQPAADPAPRSGPPLPRWLPWAGLGATLALGAGAVATGLGASHRYDELRASCGQTVEGCAQSDIDQVKSRALTTNLLWAAAGVGAVATGVVVFVNAREAGFAGAWSF